MHTKQTGAEQLPTEKRITGRPTLPIPYSLLAAEIESIESIENVIVIVVASATMISIDLTAAAERRHQVTMIEREETGRVSAKSSTVEEETLEEASTSCRMVTKSLAARVAVDEMTVTWKVPIALGWQRFVKILLFLS